MMKPVVIAVVAAVIGGATIASAGSINPGYDVYRTKDGAQLRTTVQPIPGTDCLERLDRRGTQVWVLPPSGQDPSVCVPGPTTTPPVTAAPTTAPPVTAPPTTTPPVTTTPPTTTPPVTAPPTTTPPVTTPPSTTPSTTTPPTTAPSTTTPPTTAPPTTPGGQINPMLLPGIDASRGSGASSNEVLRTATGDRGYYNGTGEVRLTCGTSHHAYDDPIVTPGQVGASHLHTFFGNAGTDANSTYESLRNEPDGSTCAGGAVNKSAYWFPSLIDNANTKVFEPTLAYVYYKTGYWGQDGADIQPMPNGLRMVSGNAAATAPQESWTANWACATHDGSGVPLQTIRSGATIPACSQNNLLVLTVMFPQCWNGTDLDSPDHKSHMAHPSYQGQCPSTHPVLLPQVTIHASWNMTADGTTALSLANDMMTPDAAGPGLGLHADFFEAWDPTLRDRAVALCLNGRRDCGVRQLGDGYLLLDV